MRSPARIWLGCACAVLFSTALATSSASAAPSLFGGATEAAKPAPGGKAAAAPNVKVTPAAKVKTAPAPKVAAPAAAPTGTATTATTATTETSSGTSSAELLILALALVLLGGIAFVIVRNARSVAPVVEGAATGGTRNPEGRLRKRRAQAKAARVQRKRHRKR